MPSSHNNIIIFSRPVRSCKTTVLFQHIKNTNKVGGFLTPDVDGSRMMYDIGEDKYYPFQKDATDVATTIQIGRFSFLNTTFQKGREIISHCSNQNLFVIDEVGKLEIENDAGFEPMISKVIDQFKNNEISGNLLLVIRDTLLEKAINKYGLNGVKIIDHL